MKKLKNVLLVNSLSSGATGLLLVAAPAPVSRIFGVTELWPFVATGVFLLMFALLVYLAYLSKRISKSLVKSIIYLDEVWVVASLVLVFATLPQLTVIGHALILAVAAWVALMAYLQYKGLDAGTGDERNNVQIGEPTRLAN
jgi:hypothetical protein